ncbi:MAG TPA: hypothetical protein PKC43_10640 [Phycisphaerales bacterium]|nr:hypothetical protein [Phycisphaerales bacterium]HMP37892.1 hypothetical protein [Phycisphaerales bacterium]
MVILFNILIVAGVVLIAYWWANQGFFSALLHLLCVLVAGAVALGVWELVAVRLLLRGGWFDEYAWGTSLLGSFALTLFLLRTATDKLVPENLNLPTWVNYTFGSLFGAAAGAITMGICLIGIGFFQSSVEIMGFRGVVRDAQASGQPTLVGRLYPPLHTWTSEFYAFVSDGALTPIVGRQTLGRSYPGLDEMALSLWRDGYREGQGKSSMVPSAASVERVMVAPTASLGRGVRGAIGVQINFDRPAFDQGEMLIVTASQVRLIGRDPSGNPVVVHPVRWVQNEPGGPVESAFDDVTSYASSIPGAQSTSILFMFPAAAFGGTQPEFVQVKGVRYALPTVPRPTSDVDWMAAKLGLGGRQLAFKYDPSAPALEDEDVMIDATIAPLTLSKNQISGMEISEDFLASGRAIFPRDSGLGMPSRALRIRGLLEPPGTKVVKLDISRGKSSVDIWGDRFDFRQRAGASAAPLLIDESGNAYAPYGFMWERAADVEIMLDPVRGIRSLSEIPSLPQSGNHTLRLLYHIPEGTHIVGVMLGRVERGGQVEGVVINNASVRVGTTQRRGETRFGEMN